MTKRCVIIQLERTRAVIFDMDGVVTDTASVHSTAWKLMFDEYLRNRAERKGRSFQPFDIRTDYYLYVDGMPRYDGVSRFLKSRDISLPLGRPDDSPDSETVFGLGNRKNRYFLDQLDSQNVVRYQSSVDFIKELKTKGVRTGIISASRNADKVLKAANVRNLFDTKVDGVDAEKLGLQGKPHPAILLEAARRLAVEPKLSVIVEDSLAGIEAGRRGNFGFVIGVDRGGHGRELEERGADAVVRDLSELRINGTSG